MKNYKTLVVGGAGYVGTELVRKLNNTGAHVSVLDTFWYWKGTNEFVEDLSFKGEIFINDLRDIELHEEVFKDIDTVVYLACVSNDPSFDLNPKLGYEINYLAFKNFCFLADKHGITRLIFASSSSVYGVKKEAQVTEKLDPEPLTDYSKYKLACEQFLESEKFRNLEWTIIRPATVCGWSARMRFDLVVNALTYSGIENKVINVHGGEQFRPNLHILDMVNLYFRLITEENLFQNAKNKIFNFGADNYKLREIAMLVKNNLSSEVQLNFEKVIDERSYRVNSDFIKNELGIVPIYTIEDAIKSIKTAFEDKKLRLKEDHILYNNIKTMNSLINAGKISI